MRGLSQSEEARKVLFVDPNCTASSPSMKGILNSTRELVAAGFSPVFWCWDYQGEEDGIEVHKLPLAGLAQMVGPLSPYLFSAVCNCYGLWQKIKGVPRPEFAFSTGFYYLGADAALIHFSQYDWINRQKQMGVRSAKDLFNLIRAGVNLVADLPQYWNPRCRLLLPVSDAVKSDLELLCPRTKKIETFPNAYDSSRFSEKIRAENRPTMREEYAFEESDVVFSFVCMGHYERKGYWLALEALSILRKDGEKQVKFLVIGGQPETLEKLRRDTALKYSDYEEWVTYTGMVSEVEKALSASDGFLFPSYSEAFSLVEIEASLLGLPLYLTPHHGSEMILEEGKNGRFLDFEPHAMAKTLKEELDKSIKPGVSHSGRALSQAEYTEAILRVIEEHSES